MKQRTRPGKITWELIGQVPPLGFMFCTKGMVLRRFNEGHGLRRFSEVRKSGYPPAGGKGTGFPG